MIGSMKITKNFAILGLASTLMFAGAGVGVAAENDVVDGAATVAAP